MPTISPTRTVPMFTPDGTLADFPAERAHEIAAAGGIVGSPIISPDGGHGMVLATRLHEALKAGAKIDDTGWTPPPKPPNAWQAGSPEYNSNPSLLERAAAMTGRESNEPPADLSRMNPLTAAKLIGQAGTPHPELAMTPEERKQNPEISNALEFAGSLASPENIAILVGSGGLGQFPGPAGKLIAKALSTGWSISQIYSALQNSPEFLDALSRGDELAARNAISKAVLSGAAAIPGVMHIAGKPMPLANDFDKNVGKFATQEPAFVNKAAGAVNEAVSGVAGKVVDAAQTLREKAGPDAQKLY